MEWPFSFNAQPIRKSRQFSRNDSVTGGIDERENSGGARRWREERERNAN